MKLKHLTAIFLLGTSLAGHASVETINTKDTVYPVTNKVVTEESNEMTGRSVLSISSRVGTPQAVPTKKSFNSKPRLFSYARGIGKIPTNGSCPTPTTEKDWGLCYKPCVSPFKGVGPMCHAGPFTKDEVLALGLEEKIGKIRQEKADARKTISGNKPVFTTDIDFHNALCTNFIEGKVLPYDSNSPYKDANFAGVINLSNKLWDKLTGEVNGAINKAINDSIASSIKGDSALSSVVSALELILLDFKVNADCADTADKKVASFGVDSSVTLSVDSKIFDSALHQVSTISGTGASIPGVANLTIYELIPFRLYGNVALTTGLSTKAKAEYLNSTPLTKVEYKRIFVNGKLTDKAVRVERTVANTTEFDIEPSTGLGIGMRAYFRIPSMLDMIPDILQVGANFDLNIIKWAMPYTFAETLQAGTAPDTLVSTKQDKLLSTLSSGDGSLIPFLKVLGIKIKVFKKKHQAKWDGYESIREIVF